MAVTVQEIYDRVTDACLEPGGFVLGVFTEAQFLDTLAVVLLDFSQRAPLDKLIYTQRITATISQYTVPDLITIPELAFVNARIIERVAEDDLTRGRFQWRQQSGPPTQWHEDNQEPKKVQLNPTPDYTGAANLGTYGDFGAGQRNLTVVGPSAPSKTSWTLADTLDGIPDSFANYLVYGILEKIFDGEDENRDIQRAAYCRARWSEAISLASAIAREELLDDEE